MQIKLYLTICLMLFLPSVSFSQGNNPDNYKNFFNISSDDVSTSTARYARQMGYDYISFKLTGATIDYSPAVFSGLKFYISNYDEYTKPPNPSWWNGELVYANVGSYTAEQIQWLEDYYIWRSATHTSTVNRLAYGGVVTSTKAKPMFCYQSPIVRQYLLDSLASVLRSRLDDRNDIGFAGWIYDEAKIRGAFGTWSGSAVTQSVLTALTPNGTDSCVAPSHIHDYGSYTDSRVEMWSKLRDTMKREYGNYTKMIAEPTRFYRTTNPEWSEYIYSASQHARKSELVMDLYMQEADDLNFLQDQNIYSSGMCDSFAVVGNTQHSEHGHNVNKLIASACGTTGAWYNWFLTYTASGAVSESTPDFTQIIEVYPRLKLIRSVPNWDNLNGVGTSNRNYDGNVYRSTHTALSGNSLISFIGTYTIYSTHWKRQNEKFVVKMGTNTHLYEPIVIGDGYYVQDIWSTNDYFEKVASVKSTQWSNTGTSWNVNSGIVVGTSTDGGIGYIFDVYKHGRRISTR